MKKLFAMLCLCGLPLLAIGCSQQTQDDASKAAEATGEAVESAAKDVVNEAEKLTDEAKDAVDGSNSSDNK